MLCVAQGMRRAFEITTGQERQINSFEVQRSLYNVTNLNTSLLFSPVVGKPPPEARALLPYILTSVALDSKRLPSSSRVAL